MKNQVKLCTLLISATVYLFALIFVAGAGAGVLVLLVLYSVAAIAGGNALLASDLATAERDAQTFRKEKPLRGLGLSLADFQHVFYHDEDLLPTILNEINTRILKRGFLPALQSKTYTDTDKNLNAPEAQEFFMRFQRQTLVVLK